LLQAEEEDIANKETGVRVVVVDTKTEEGEEEGFRIGADIEAVDFRTEGDEVVDSKIEEEDLEAGEEEDSGIFIFSKIKSLIVKTSFCV
jgi:hypothetical protein